MPSPSDLFVYFDSAPIFGVLNGAIQVEVAANELHAADGKVESRSATVARLRCSPAAALNLIAALQKAVELAQNTAQPQAQAKSLN